MQEEMALPGSGKQCSAGSYSTWWLAVPQASCSAHPDSRGRSPSEFCLCPNQLPNRCHQCPSRQIPSEFQRHPRVILCQLFFPLPTSGPDPTVPIRYWGWHTKIVSLFYLTPPADASGQIGWPKAAFLMGCMYSFYRNPVQTSASSGAMM